MIKAYYFDNQKDWMKEPISFCLLLKRQLESLGFSPFELVFGHIVRGPLRVIDEGWFQDTNLLHYVSEFKYIMYRLYQARDPAHKNLKETG